MSLHSRVRPTIEASLWVCDEIAELEDRLAAAEKRLDFLNQFIVSCEDEDTGKITFSASKGALRECIDSGIEQQNLKRRQENV